MILVDSSALIEYYRPSGDPVAQAAVAEAVVGDSVAINGIIQVELMAFASRQVDYDNLADDFGAFHWLELGHAQFDLAADLGFRLRKDGVTVPATDLLIAASAIDADAALYHLDAHYDQIARHSTLQATNLQPGSGQEGL